jgi:DNA-directed RNA polymerase specialized sigma24 family protein
MHPKKGRQRCEAHRLAGEIYRERHGYLMAIALRHSQNEADAQESMQEAFISFMRSFDPTGPAPALAWLTLTLKRECWRRTRDRHLDRCAGQEADPDKGEVGFVWDWIVSRGASLEDRIAERDVARRLLGELKPDQRTSLGLLGAGFSYKEIARLKSWTYTKVNRCITRGRAALAAA